MIAQQVSVKLFAVDPAVDLTRFIPIFHGWIQENRIPGRLLIDVADYRHVAHGPGVMLIGNEAHYALDSEHGPLGLMVSRKRDEPGDLDAKLAEGFADALFACRLLEQDPSQLIRFRGDRARVSVMSRRFAAGGEDSWAAARPAFEAIAARLFPGIAVAFRHETDPRAPFSVDIEAPGAPGVSELLARL